MWLLGDFVVRRLASPSRRRAQAARRPELELLEQRLALSTYYVATTGSDKSAGTLASPFATMQHAMMSLKPGDTLDVEPGTYAGFIVGWDSTPASSGDPYGYVDGTASAPITIQAAPGSAAGSVVINSADNKTQAGIDLEPGDNYITISGFAINGSTGGIAASPNKGEGIKIAGSTNVTVKNTTVTGIGYGFGIIADNANNVVLEDNTITGTGDGGNSDYGHGIYISGSTNDAVVVGNTIANNAYIGIHINGDASEGGIGLVTNALVENNVIYNNGQNGINADGLQSSVIENNLIYNYQNYGICLYQSDAAAGSKNNVIVDNTIDSGTSTGTGGAIRILDSSTGNTILNNILLDGSTNVYRIAADSVSGTVSNYNVVSVGAQVQSDDTGSEEPFSSWQSSTGQDKNSFSATPAQLFVSPSANNFQELSTSPSIGKGTSTHAPSTDILGNARPSDKGFDIGCYQYQSTELGSPTVVSMLPTANAMSVPTTISLTATFDEAVVSDSISFILVGPDGAFVPATVGYSSATKTATLTPSSPLAPSTRYTASISGVEGQSGGVMAGSVTWTFTTNAPAPVPPVVITGVQSVLNRRGQITKVVITFSGPLDGALAQETGNYRLAIAGKHGSFTTRTARIVKPLSAIYNADGQVTLILKKAISFSRPIQLQVNGKSPSGLRDSFGRYIDGGSNAVAVLLRG